MVDSEYCVLISGVGFSTSGKHSLRHEAQVNCVDIVDFHRPTPEAAFALDFVGGDEPKCALVREGKVALETAVFVVECCAVVNYLVSFPFPDDHDSSHITRNDVCAIGKEQLRSSI